MEPEEVQRSAQDREILERFVYRAPNDRQKILLSHAHILTMSMATFIVDHIPNSRDRSLALTSLEDTRMKINKAIVFADLD